ncbi:MAG: tripartite tricarboxylate transporter TctB family protein [Roseicyclus sp.]|jgi:hypothetical protein
MRIAFLIVVLAGAVFYSYIAFIDLNFLTRTGRLGPGFFPRIVGVAMVVFTFWALVDALRERRAAQDDGSAWRDVVTLMALAVGYAVLLRLLGGFPATVVYLGLSLVIVNPGRHLQNAILTAVIPTAIYLLFDRLLNANMPPALLDLPF